MDDNMLSINEVNELIKRCEEYDTLDTDILLKVLNELKMYKERIKEGSMIPLKAPIYSKVFVIEDISKNGERPKYAVREKEYLLSDVASYTKIFNSYEDARKACDRVNTKEVKYNGW